MYSHLFCYDDSEIGTHVITLSTLKRDRQPFYFFSRYSKVCQEDVITFYGLCPVTYTAGVHKSETTGKRVLQICVLLIQSILSEKWV